MKKFYIFIIILIIIFSSYIIINHIPRNYTYDYKYKDFKIIEKYDKDNKIYTFNITTKEDIKYDYALASKYYAKRGLITKLKLKDNCLEASLKKLDGYSVCKESNNYYTSFYNDKDDAKKKDTYEKIDIYNLNDHKYLIWNYNNFIALSNKENKVIKLFENDEYVLSLIHQDDDRLILADYDAEYTYNNLYIIGAKKFNVDKLKLDKDIYLNSYFMGVYKDNLYIYDKQKKLEYKVDLDNGVVDKTGYKVLVDGKFQETTETKLSNNTLKFTNNTLFKYILDNNTLYYETPVNKINVTRMPVDKLVYQNDKEVYFISQDTLYYGHIDKGITKLLSYSEWQFNNHNIYIF